jgi:hypothetical protein
MGTDNHESYPANPGAPFLEAAMHGLKLAVVARIRQECHNLKMTDIMITERMTGPDLYQQSLWRLFSAATLLLFDAGRHACGRHCPGWCIRHHPRLPRTPGWLIQSPPRLSLEARSVMPRGLLLIPEIVSRSKLPFNAPVKTEASECDESASLHAPNWYRYLTDHDALSDRP